MSYDDQIGRIRNLARSFAFMHSSVDAIAREHTAEENCDAEIGQGGDPTAAYASLAAEIEMEPTEYRRLLVREYRAAGGRGAR